MVGLLPLTFGPFCRLQRGDPVGDSGAPAHQGRDLGFQGLDFGGAAVQDGRAQAAA
jgi:hypothetical protein